MPTSFSSDDKELPPECAVALKPFIVSQVLECKKSAQKEALGLFPHSRDWNGKLMEGAIRSIAPHDAIEAMLAVQMLQTHNLAIEYLQRAASKTQTTLGIEMFSNFANRMGMVAKLDGTWT